MACQNCIRASPISQYSGSISMMTIVVNAEEKFGVTIPDDEVKNLKTVGDAVDYIVGHQD